MIVIKISIKEWINKIINKIKERRMRRSNEMYVEYFELEKFI